MAGLLDPDFVIGRDGMPVPVPAASPPMGGLLGYVPPAWAAGGINIEDYTDHPSSAAQVPPDTMQDSPRSFAPVDTGGETTTEIEPLARRTENRRARDAETNELLRELQNTRLDTPAEIERHRQIYRRLDQLMAEQDQSDATRWMQRQYNVRDAVPGTADAIMEAITRRQRLGRGEEGTDTRDLNY